MHQCQYSYTTKSLCVIFSASLFHPYTSRPLLPFSADMHRDAMNTPKLPSGQGTAETSRERHSPSAHENKSPAHADLQEHVRYISTSSPHYGSNIHTKPLATSPNTAPPCPSLNPSIKLPPPSQSSLPPIRNPGTIAELCMYVCMQIPSRMHCT